MSLLDDTPINDSPLPALPDSSRLIPDRNKETLYEAPTPSGEACLRCGGMLILSYTATMERDIIGRPMRLWRCVNCGDCMDSCILANRRNRPVRLFRPRQRTGPQEAEQPRGTSTR